jgi:hypothetical protein
MFFSYKHLQMANDFRQVLARIFSNDYGIVTPEEARGYGRFYRQFKRPTIISLAQARRQFKHSNV